MPQTQELQCQGTKKIVYTDKASVAFVNGYLQHSNSHKQQTPQTLEDMTAAPGATSFAKLLCSN